jgi:tetrahydromethanopterin S-methyltransferase subunit F
MNEPTKKETDSASQLITRKASLLDTVKAVGASFFGVRGSKSHAADMAKLNPLVVIAVGVVMAGLFVVTLLAIVKMVVNK